MGLHQNSPGSFSTLLCLCCWLGPGQPGQGFLPPCIWKYDHFREFKFDSLCFVQRDCRYSHSMHNVDFFLYFASFPF